MGAKRLSIDSNAVFFDVYLNCYGNSNRLKQALFTILTTTGLPDTCRPVLKKLLVNLALVPDGSALALPLNHDFYGRIDAKNAGLSYSKVTKVLDALIGNKFVQVIKGTEATGITRVYPLHKLQIQLKMLTDIIYLEKKDAGLLVLRDRFKNDLNIERNGTTLALIRDLNSINTHLLKHKYIAQGKRFFPQLTRVFNEDFESGGRFYSHNYQSLSHKGGARQTIQIDGAKTVELDYKAIHPTILYSWVDAPYPADPYSIPMIPRDDAKRAFNIMINAGTMEEASGAIQHNQKMSRQYSEAEAEMIIDALKSVNMPIAGFLNTGAGLKLQFQDSRLCEAILLESIAADKAILPIHDSFICKKEDQEWLEDIMIRKGKEVLGISFKVEKK